MNTKEDAYPNPQRARMLQLQLDDPENTQQLTNFEYNKLAKYSNSTGDFTKFGLKYRGGYYAILLVPDSAIRYYTITDHKLWCFWRLRAGI